MCVAACDAAGVAAAAVAKLLKGERDAMGPTMEALGPALRASALRVGGDALTSLQRPFYDVRTAMHGAAWAVLRPLMTREWAVALIEAGLTPAVVRLTAETGTLTLYDSAMVHRGGTNRGSAPRPILAVHMRPGDPSEYGPARDATDASKQAAV